MYYCKGNLFGTLKSLARYLHDTGQQASDAAAWSHEALWPLSVDETREVNKRIAIFEMEEIQ